VANGEEEFHAGATAEEELGANPLVDESENGAPEMELSNKLVFVITDSGAVGGVNVLVYKAVPLRIRKLVMYPGQNSAAELFAPM
jgi:hypothetical protein